MAVSKEELEMKHILVFGEKYPASVRAMIESHGTEDFYSVYYKEREKEEHDIEATQDPENNTIFNNLDLFI